MLKKVIPVSLRRQLVENFFVREVLIPREEISTRNMQAFWEVVSDDASAFLIRHGKHPDFWDLTVSDEVLMSVK